MLAALQLCFLYETDTVFTFGQGHVVKESQFFFFLQSGPSINAMYVFVGIC